MHTNQLQGSFSIEQAIAHLCDDDQYGRSMNPTAPKTIESFISLTERKRLHLSAHRYFWRQRQEFLSVSASQVGDGADHPFAPEETIGEGRKVAHVDAGTYHGASFGRRSQGGRDQLADRSVKDRGVQLFGRQ